MSQESLTVKAPDSVTTTLKIDKQKEAKAEDPISMLKAEIVGIMNKPMLKPSGSGVWARILNGFSHVHSYRTQKLNLMIEALARIETYNVNAHKDAQVSKEVKRTLLIECFNESVLQLDKDECEYINHYLTDGKSSIFAPKGGVGLTIDTAQTPSALLVPLAETPVETPASSASIASPSTLTPESGPSPAISQQPPVIAVLKPTAHDQLLPAVSISTYTASLIPPATTITTATTTTTEAIKENGAVGLCLPEASQAKGLQNPKKPVVNTSAATTKTATTTTVVSEAQAQTAVPNRKQNGFVVCPPLVEPKTVSTVTLPPADLTFVLQPVIPTSTPPVASTEPVVEETEMLRLHSRLTQYIDAKKFDPKRNPAKIHGPTYGLRSDQHKKKAIAEELNLELTKSPVDQLVAIRKAIRANRKATGPQLRSGELAKILTGMETTVLKDLSPANKAFADLKDYREISIETKQAENSTLHGLRSIQTAKLSAADTVLSFFNRPCITGWEGALDAAIIANKKATVRSSPFYYGKLNEIFEDLKRSMTVTSSDEPEVVPTVTITQ